MSLKQINFLAFFILDFLSAISLLLMMPRWTVFHKVDKTDILPFNNILNLSVKYKKTHHGNFKSSWEYSCFMHTHSEERLWSQRYIRPYLYICVNQLFNIFILNIQTEKSRCEERLILYYSFVYYCIKSCLDYTNIILYLDLYLILINREKLMNFITTKKS